MGVVVKTDRWGCSENRQMGVVVKADRSGCSGNNKAITLENMGTDENLRANLLVLSLIQLKNSR